MMKHLVSLAMVLLAIGCEVPAVYEITPASITREESLRRSVASILGDKRHSLEQATRLMESEGYVCRHVNSSSFDFSAGASGAVDPKPPYDFLLCSREVNTRGDVYLEQVALLLSDSDETTGRLLVNRQRMDSR